MTRSRAQLLPPGWVAQPLLGGERNGTKWELNRVYDPAGDLHRDRSYWEIRHTLGDDPEPRSVAWGDLGRVSYAAFSRLTTPLEQVERWLTAARKRAVKEARRGERAPWRRLVPVGG